MHACMQNEFLPKYAKLHSMQEPCSGKLDFSELMHDLKNDANSNFKPETCRMMISMFDREGDSQINPASWKLSDG